MIHLTMPSNTTIASEIDAIISRAMNEYYTAHGIAVPEGMTTTQSPSSSPLIVEETHEDTPQVLPPNTKSVLVEETSSRFSGAVWYDAIQKTTITLAGLGGIGSYVAFLLARMKPSALYLFDDDIVEAGNLSGQLYGLSNIGERKANAIAAMTADYADFHKSYSITERFTESCAATDIMICGFDNMTARSTFFHSWLNHVNILSEEDKKNCLFIDGRLAAEEFQVLAIQGDDDRAIGEYEAKWLFSEEEADATICSYKQTSFCANMIASIMVNLFVNFIANKCDTLVPRDVPFLTTYDASTMFFKVRA